MSIEKAFAKRKKELIELKDVRKRHKPGIKEQAKSIPKGENLECTKCKTVLDRDKLRSNLFICECGEYLRMRSFDRILSIVDSYTFKEFGTDYKNIDPLQMPGYKEKLDSFSKQSGVFEAYVYGICRIEGIKCVLGVMDSHFLMGSMGSVVGEKVTKTFQLGIEQQLPVIIFTASGGARMQEGIFSLMQMAKTSAEITKFYEKGLLYISVLTDPTTGGVTASYTMLADIIVAEPQALIGFAGPRVIEQTIKQKLPHGFQRSEFLQDKGFIDLIVPRKEMKQKLAALLDLHKR